MARASLTSSEPHLTAACAERRLLDLIANKWSSLIVIALAGGTLRFQQLRREIDGVTQKMLTQSLRALERDGLLTRQVFAEVPPRVEYRLTPLGQSFLVPLRGLKRWAEANVDAIESARAKWDASSKVGQR